MTVQHTKYTPYGRNGSNFQCLSFICISAISIFLSQYVCYKVASRLVERIVAGFLPPNTFVCWRSTGIQHTSVLHSDDIQILLSLETTLQIPGYASIPSYPQLNNIYIIIYIIIYTYMCIYIYVCVHTQKYIYIYIRIKHMHTYARDAFKAGLLLFELPWVAQSNLFAFSLTFSACLD